LLPDSLRNKTTTIYNPFPITKILKLSSEECSPYTKKNTVKLLSIGRFVPQKNYPNLINAMRILKEEYNFPFELIIIGSGPKEEEIKQLISDFSLNDNIQLYPETNNPYKFISKSDIFVLSSDFEGFGNVIVEALICNKKVVSTNCPSGPSEILKNGEFGFLCDINSPKDLANTIYKANNSNLPQGIENRVQDFSIKNIFRDYQKVICDK